MWGSRFRQEAISSVAAFTCSYIRGGGHGGDRVQVYFCLVRACVARSWWPGPGSRWPGPGGPVPVPGPGGPVPCRASFFAVAPVARSRSRSRSRSLPSVLPSPGPAVLVLVARSRWPGVGGAVPVTRVPVRIKRITYAVWPASMSPGMDAQSLPGIWLFYAVLQTTGERQTIFRSRNHYRTKTGAKRLPKPTA